MSALEASITLEEVFSVLTSKRVPLAPELAGYLALELAEGAGTAPGEIEPKQVYIGDEGSVAIVRRPSQSDANPDPASAALATRSAEASIRAILQRLLDASGSQTPSLAMTAKKKAGAGVPALMAELEAALIPVNRAAGRRALARLAREAKRVTLGVGRNAAGTRASSPSHPQLKDAVAAEAKPPSPSPRPPAASNFSLEEVPTTARREVPPEVLAAPVLPSDVPPPAEPAQRAGGLVIKSAPVDLQRPPSVNELPTVELGQSGLAAPGASSEQRDSVDSLLSQFEVSASQEKEVKNDLKAIAGLEPTPPPPQDADSGLDDLLAMSRSSSVPPASMPPAAKKPSLPPPTAPPVREPSERPGAIGSEPPPSRKPVLAYEDDRSMQTEPARVKRAPTKSRGIDKVLIILFFVLLAGGAVMVWMLKPGFFTGRTPEKIAEEERAAAAASAKAAELTAMSKQCKESISLTDVPPKAEVAMRVGVAPVDVPHIPMQTRLELIATLDTYATKRAVVLPDATWDKGPDGKPRLETAVQLDPLGKHHGKTAPDVWPPVEPGSDVGGADKASPGTLHIVSSPKGAEIWMLVGLGPETQIDDVPCGDVDLLLGGPGTYRKKIHVRAADFSAGEPAPNGDTIKTAKVSAK